jgi:hypothetical protein
MNRRHRRQKMAILRDVPPPNLIAAIGGILRVRYLREHPELDPETYEWASDNIDARGFIDESSVEQVRMLRDIALGMKMIRQDRIQ